ncbi:MAG: hypothetical protein E7268_05105 [Lachnospiraceae bacterium]|nr:hypothetical protein [Lachnospiraceae bacterium]
MIVTILELRAHILRFLQKFQLVVEPVIKFIIAFAVFHSINKAIGHHEMLMSLPAELLLSLLGTFTPSILLVLLAAVVSLVHVYVASPLLAILVAIIMVILYCFIARFSGKYGYVVLAVPILFLLKIPYVVPLILGLIATPMAIIPAACGIIVYRLFVVISNVALVEESMGIEDILLMYIDVIDRLLADKQMLVTIGVFFIIILAMYLMRKLSIEYVFEISIAVGAIVCILGFLAADTMMQTEMNIVSMVFGTVGSMVIALVFQFFRLALDYTAVERVQFEDDDYYYYVKAVPKMNLTVPKRSVKKISEKSELLQEEAEPEEEETPVLSDEERYAMGEELDDEPYGESEDDNGDSLGE